MGSKTVAVGLLLLAAGHPGGAFVPSVGVGRGRRTMSSARGLQMTVTEVAPTRNGVAMRSEGSYDELASAVETLTKQVQDLTVLVKELAVDVQPTAAVPAEKGGASEAVAPVATKAADKTGAASDLVSTSAADARIRSWLSEQGVAVPPPPPAPAAAAPVAPAVEAAAPAAAAAAVPLPPPVAAPPAPAAPVEMPASPDAGEGGGSAETGYKVMIDWDGAKHEVTCEADQTVLDAAMDAGLELPHSCMSGSCLACAGKIVSGKVDQSEGVLEDEQLEKGFMLTCISYPESDLHFKVIEEDELE